MARTYSQDTVDRLLAVISDALSQVETSRCTCPTTDAYNALHMAPGRRRKDSRCSGVAASVGLEHRTRRRR
jgi:hypothetical protein